MKKWCYFIFFILFMAILGVALFFYQIQQFYHAPIRQGVQQLFTIERGVTATKLVSLLQSQQIITDARLLPWLLRLHPELNQIKAGTYDLNGITTVAGLLNHFNAGKEAQLTFRFVEGETFKNELSKLQHAPYLSLSLPELSEQEWYALLELPQGEHYPQKIEGWLYPDTYHYTPYSSDVALLKRATQQMQQKLNQAWQQRQPNLPLKTPYEMLILASIVEKETALATERPLVASVFINRLNRKMRLQTDPTVIYGMGEHYQAPLRRQDLIQPTDYNTYVIAGLPPTPIAMPSEASLLAVANPAKTPYFYFVADGQGGHKFSKTLTEHNRAVRAYVRWLQTQKCGK